MTPGQGAARAGRVVAFALPAVAVGSAAHVAGGGHVPGWGLLVALPLVMIAINPLAARRRGVPSLAAAMAGVQALLHVTFMAADPIRDGGTCSPVTSHGHDVVVHCTSAPMAMAVPSTFMLATHVLAAGLLVLLLARGEAALWALADWVRFRVRRFTAAPNGPVGASCSPSPIRFVMPARRELRTRTFRRRGPPVKHALA